MFCYSCQAPNKVDNLFCTSCGARLAPPSPGQAAEVRAHVDEGGEASRTTSPDAEGLRRAGLPAQDTGSEWAGAPRFENASGDPDRWPRLNGMALTPYAPPLPSQYQGNYPSLATITCARCGFPRSSAMETCPRCGRALMNNSGQNESIPAELASGWNWGAFMLPVVWSIAHETWFGLLALVPGLNIVVPFVLASRGNELAWQNRRFHSIAHFQEVQRVWRNCAIGVGAVSAALLVMMLFAMAS
ncbi:MAG TPA: hypothetical protein VFJ58_27855 [Armatimonadota bacterium]|nr:hypothetical protein [Armatimonadota bacterium]